MIVAPRRAALDTAPPPIAAIAAAAASGFGVMAAELTAVRLLAPHFGDSAYVWTNVIGVILAAMAIGAVLGGRLASRDDADRWPVRLLVAGGVLLLLAPFATTLLAALLLPADLPLDAAMPALIRGSLVATAVVFAPPLLLLASVSPLLVVQVARRTTLGRAAGNISAAGTIGSLAGTFAATHWLVPTFGCRVALAIAALVLLGAAFALAVGRQRSVAGSALLLSLLAPWLHQGPLRPAPDGQQLLAERESAYQFLQVLRDNERADGPRSVRLVINEALDSFHSLQLEDSAFTGGNYYDWHALAPLLAGDGVRPDDARALSIGDAAGTLRMVYAAVHPGLPVDSVDIDAATMALGDAYFEADKAAGERFALDGRLFLERAKRRWHVVHVDAYAHQVYVPAHLASVEFFRTAHSRLEDGGVLACNIGALDLDDDVLQAVGATIAAVFGRERVRVLKIPGTRNALLVARRGHALDPAALTASASDADARASSLSVADRRHWRDILQTGARAESWHAITADEPVLLDDRPLLDELLFASYVERRDPRRVVAATGQRTIEDSEQRAHEAILGGDWAAVLDAVAESHRVTPLLCHYAGDARWHLRQLHSARLEYDRGLMASPSASLAQTLQAKLAALSDELAPIERAEAAAVQNGWFAVLVVVAGAMLGLFFAYR